MSGTRSAIVIGGGPAGLMAAQVIANAGHAVTVFDHMPSFGRKFLMAGRGGLNLTHGEDIEALLARYEGGDWLARHIADFPPKAVRAWAADLGEPTFAGSSGRIFPQSFKASPLLRAWLKRLAASGVRFRPSQRWIGLEPDGSAVFADRAGLQSHVKANCIVLALGGASWPKLGSDAGWTAILAQRGIGLTPFQPSNCGFDIAWSDHFRDRFAGVPLTTIAVALEGSHHRGSAMITGNGIEGGVIYGLSRPLRARIRTAGSALIHIDLRPDVAAPVLAQRLARARAGQSMATLLRKAGGLSPAGIGLMQENAHHGGHLPRQAEALAALVKAVPLTLTGLATIDRAISSAGGVAGTECSVNLMLKRLPGVFVAGEMLDWDAPTGGYLLQACLSTGAAAGRGAAAWLTR